MLEFHLKVGVSEFLPFCFRSSFSTNNNWNSLRRVPISWYPFTMLLTWLVHWFKVHQAPLVLLLHLRLLVLLLVLLLILLLRSSHLSCLLQRLVKDGTDWAVEFNYAYSIERWTNSFTSRSQMAFYPPPPTLKICWTPTDSRGEYPTISVNDGSCIFPITDSAAGRVNLVVYQPSLPKEWSCKRRAHWAVLPFWLVNTNRHIKKKEEEEEEEKEEGEENPFHLQFRRWRHFHPSGSDGWK